MDTSTAAGLAIGAVADLLLGDPRRGHPVAGFGSAAAAIERRYWRNSRARGTAYALGLTAGPVVVGLLANRATRTRPRSRTLVLAAATWTVLGGTSLGRAADRMHMALAAGDVPAGRAELPALAGRDPSPLDEGDLVRATVESVAENTADAAVAPTEGATPSPQTPPAPLPLSAAAGPAAPAAGIAGPTPHLPTGPVPPGPPATPVTPPPPAGPVI